MKKLLLGSVATGALLAAGSAHAADLGMRPAYKAAPVAPPVPVFSWTGCYVGGHVGWGWGKHDVSESFTTVSDGSSFTRAGSQSIDSSGAIFGGQVGCDYQFAGAWVIGIQGAISGADINGVGPDPLDLTDQGDALSVKTDSIGSVTGRLGFTGWIPQTLLYVKGGVAWAHEKWTLTELTLCCNVSNSSTASLTRTGWTVGAGVEWAFAPNWSAFVEWDHYDFGSKNITGYNSISSSCSGSGNACGDAFSLDAKSRIETVKVGVNWRFNFLGKGPAAMQARY